MPISRLVARFAAAALLVACSGGSAEPQADGGADDADTVDGHASKPFGGKAGTDGGALPAPNGKADGGGTPTPGGGDGGAGGDADGGSGGDGGPAGPTVAQTCMHYAQTYCQRVATCSSYLFASVFNDPAVCLARLTTACVTEHGAAGVSSPVAELDACAAALQAATCADVVLEPPPASCRPAGTHLDGTHCAFDSQCKSAYCATPSPGCGICTARGAVGGACRVREDCEPPLHCADNKTCRAAVAPGVKCDAAHPCDSQSFCGQGVCKARRANGAACNADRLGADCQPGLTCIPMGNGAQCAPIVVANAGQVCYVVSQSTQCTAGSTCDFRPKGKCVAPAADGAACSAASHVGCLFPAQCVGGKCELPSGPLCP